MAIAITLREYLDGLGIDYDIVEHPHSWTSSETARKARISGDRLAKSVLLEDEQGYLVAVIPTTHRVELGLLHRKLDRHIGLATEAEVADVFADCEPGAIPPTGNAYGIQTLLDCSLLEQQDIYFEAGDHEELIHVNREQFEELMEGADTGYFSTHR